MKIASITCACKRVLTPLMEGLLPVNGAECDCGMVYVILRRKDGDLEIQVHPSEIKNFLKDTKK